MHRNQSRLRIGMTNTHEPDGDIHFCTGKLSGAEPYVSEVEAQ